MTEDMKRQEKLKKEKEKALYREKEDQAKKKLGETMKERIDQLCKLRGLTYYTLSYKASIPMSTLMHIINGDSNNPGIYTIVKICDGLDITLEEFFGTKKFEEAITESRNEK